MTNNHKKLGPKRTVYLAELLKTRLASYQERAISLKQMANEINAEHFEWMEGIELGDSQLRTIVNSLGMDLPRTRRGMTPKSAQAADAVLVRLQRIEEKLDTVIEHLEQG